MTLVAGVDSSTQSCKVVIRDAGTGAFVRSGRAPHPDGTEVDPAEWGAALGRAVADAGGLADVAAVAVGGQQHGMVCLDEGGAVVRPALLWNDTRSAAAAAQLVDDLPGGAAEWAERTGSVPLASFTVTKLRWLVEHEPHNASATAAVCLPHDWITWQLAGAGSLESLTTDRGDASGTGYWSPARGTYDDELLHLALGSRPIVPEVLAPSARAGTCRPGILARDLLPAELVLAPGTGDNAAAALGLGAQPGDVIVSIGTSGVVSAVSTTGCADPSGIVAGFADATGRFLPLVCTLNAARVLDAARSMLDVSFEKFADLALSAPAGAGGLVLVPYLEGERTPNKPFAAGALHGMRVDNCTPANLARAAVEGLLCGLADGLDALRAQGTRIDRLLLIGGGAQSAAVRRIAPAVFGLPVVVPAAGEYVADGAARQAAWTLGGSAEPPDWRIAVEQVVEADPRPEVRESYAAVRDLTVGA